MLDLMYSSHTQFWVKLRHQEKWSALIQAPSIPRSQFEKASTVCDVILDYTRALFTCLLQIINDTSAICSTVVYHQCFYTYILTPHSTVRSCGQIHWIQCLLFVMDWMFVPSQIHTLKPWLPMWWYLEMETLGGNQLDEVMRVGSSWWD